jgi:hypothetical protein
VQVIAKAGQSSRRRFPGLLWPCHVFPDCVVAGRLPTGY